MSRIAILADIHGNVPALEAVIADISKQAVDEVLVGGDLVGRGPEGSAVTRRIRDLEWSSIRGNHEDYVLTFRRGEVPSDWLEADEWAASRWMAEELSEEDADFLDSLPLSLTSRLEPELRLFHGSPRGPNDGIGPWTTDRQMEAHAASVRESLLVCAHTHRPLDRSFSTGRIVNVGSVGLPFNGDQRAQYAIFEFGGDGLDVEFRRVDYDLNAILRIYETSGFLAAGGVTAQLLKMELEQAEPFLVPFLHWASTLGVDAVGSNIRRFLDFYDPKEPMRSFVSRLEAARATGS
ncbi:MAG: metallophosphoesterase family protein [Acidobacteriota bacterium]